jgi:SAM-dependent methyltransferase
MSVPAGGLFLAAARERGWGVRGLDRNRHAAEAANVAFGLEFATTLDEIPDRSVDVMRLSHVLEHVAHPVAFLTELRVKLRPDGILAVIVPNGAPLSYAGVNMLRRLRTRMPKLTAPMSPGFHVLGFTRSSLATVARKAGYSSESVRSISMGNKTFYPMFYDGLMGRVRIREIPAVTLVRYWLPLFADNLGNPFGWGNWLVAYFRVVEMSARM